MRRAHAAALALILLTLVVTLVVVASRFTTDTPEPEQPEATRTVQAPRTPGRATPAPAPEADGCYQLTYTQALAPTTRADPVPCGRSHTSQTFLVTPLDLVSAGHLLAVDSREAQDQAARRCRARLAGHLGAPQESLRLSMVDVVWFTPSVEQGQEGADWLRCDVVAVSGGQRLARLPASTRGMLGSDAGRERFAMCATAAPGDQGFERVVCSARHSWRAVASVPLAGRAYPTAAESERVMKPRCRAIARRSAADPLDFRWAEERPSADQWRRGQHYGLCWVPG